MGRKAKTKKLKEVDGQNKLVPELRTVRLEVRITERHKQILDWLVEHERESWPSSRKTSQADMIMQALDYLARRDISDKIYPLK